MTDRLLTVEQAAAALGVTSRTVISYSKKKKLTKHKQPGSNRVYYSSEELEELKKEREGVNSPIEVRSLRAKVHRLEHQVGMLMSLLRVRAEPLDAVEQRSLLQKAREEKEPWSVEKMVFWHHIFISMDPESDQDLDVLLSLASNMKRYAHSKAATARGNIQVRIAHALLVESYDTLLKRRWFRTEFKEPLRFQPDIRQALLHRLCR